MGEGFVEAALGISKEVAFPEGKAIPGLFILQASIRPGGYIGKGPMSMRICRCCGEPMADHGNILSRNPNICASCSSLLDGMDGMDGMELPAWDSVAETEGGRTESTAAEPVPLGGQRSHF